MYNLPEEGSEWVHHLGKTYRVVCVANTENNNPNQPTTVVFQSVVNKNYWTKTVEDFFEKMEPV